MKVGGRIEFNESYNNVRTSGLDSCTRIACAEIKCSRCKYINIFSISEEVLCKN